MFKTDRQFFFIISSSPALKDRDGLKIVVFRHERPSETKIRDFFTPLSDPRPFCMGFPSPV